MYNIIRCMLFLFFFLGISQIKIENRIVENTWGIMRY